MADTDTLHPPPPELLDSAALFLDFDGTLVPLTDVPEAVVVDATLIALLGHLRDALSGRLAIVSGRSVATLRGLFGLNDFLLAGSHGIEFAQPGQAVEAPTRLSAVDEAETALLEFASDKPGILIERKTLSVGLHYRQAPEFADACHALTEAVAARTGLYLQTGKMIYELRPGGADKGTAITAMMHKPPMIGGIPVFLGDDVTDEDGFIAVRALGGHGILVGPPRDTAAQWRLEQVGDVRHYLMECAARPR